MKVLWEKRKTFPSRRSCSSTSSKVPLSSTCSKGGGGVAGKVAGGRSRPTSGRSLLVNVSSPFALMGGGGKDT